MRQKPLWLFLEINQVCNLRCKQCRIWMNPPAKPGTLTLEEHKQILRDLKAWPGEEDTRVVLGGGEALLNPERVLPLVRFARELEIPLEILSNGTLIDDTLAGHLLEAGPAQINISIDAPRSEVHEYMRGVRGAFDLSVGNLRRLSERGGDISVNAIICKSTLPYLLEHVQFLKEAGAREVRFLPIAPTIGNQFDRDPFFEKESAISEDELAGHFDPLIELRREDEFVANPIEDLVFIRRYLANPAKVVREEAMCESGDKIMVVSEYGAVGLCHYQPNFFPQKTVFNVRDISLREHWQSHLDFRREMLQCKQACSIYSCHRKNGI